MSNVYRVSMSLKEEINERILQEALDLVLPKFELFCCRLNQGFFWYYFEQNYKLPRRVHKEHAFPCRYISANRNRGYLFRVAYYECRINLEVYHVLTDGMGAFNFLKELVYQYLRLCDEELAKRCGDELSQGTSTNTRDSFLEHFEKKNVKPFRFKRAYLLKGPLLNKDALGIIHGSIPIDQLKNRAKYYGVSLNEYMVAAINWAVYQTYKEKMDFSKPLNTCVPVNLRPFYQSDTTKNFFINVTSVFQPTHKNHTFGEVVSAVSSSLREQINKENLEVVLSGNVSTERNWMIRVSPLVLKRITLKYAYHFATKATTLTVSNLGKITVDPEYKDRIDHVGVILPNATGQHLKMSLVSYDDHMMVTISSILKSAKVQNMLFAFLREEGIDVAVSDNNIHPDLVRDEDVQKEAIRENYPDAKKEIKRLKIASNIYIAAALLCELIVLGSVGLVWGRWDLCALLACFMAYAYATLRGTVNKKVSFKLKLTMQLLMAILLLCGIDYFTGAHGWSFTYVYPGVVILIEVVIGILMLVQRRSWQSYLLMQILIIILSLLPLFLYHYNIIPNIILPVISFAVAIGSFIYTVIIGGKRSRDELKRRFHL